MYINEILDNINIKDSYIFENKKVDAFSKDTRTINNNDVYFAIKVDTFDGNDYIIDAFSKGSSLVIGDNPSNDTITFAKENNKNLIIVEDTVKALQELATYKRSLYNIPVIAITGSAGKTSTKDIVYSVLATKYSVLKTPGNLNNHIGLPLTILSLKDEDILLVEMGMNHFGELRVLSNIAKPTVAIITNIGTAHIGNLGSKENILKAKLEILDGLQEDGKFIINNDDELLNKEKDKHNNVYTYGINNDSFIKASDVILNESSASFKVDDYEYELNISGEHFVYNALCAITVGKLFDIPESSIKEGLLNFTISANRMDVIKTKGYTLIDDSYNANYDAMVYALKYLNNLSGRKIAVLGTMLELGDFSKDIHLKLGKEIDNLNIDLVLTVGEDAKYINEGIRNTLNYHFKTNEEVINYLKDNLKENDYVLIKASHSLNFKEIVLSLK